jgi:hypothetical protein
VMKKLKMKQLIICSVLLLIGFSANAQISGKSIPELRQAAAAPFQPSIVPAFHYSNFPLLQLSKLKPNFPHSNPTVPIVYSYNNLAFFCKIEVKMEKAAKLPIKFRLGDVDYVDRLEGKRE